MVASRLAAAEATEPDAATTEGPAGALLPSARGEPPNLMCLTTGRETGHGVPARPWDSHHRGPLQAPMPHKSL